MVLVVLLAGCGFHMPGELTAPAEMQRTYIDPVERNSLFHRELRRRLQSAGVELVDTPAEATAIMVISADETDQRVLSVSARNVPTEYEVYYLIEYSLLSGEKRLLEPQFLTRTRSYTYDETLVLGKAREEQLLREAIVKDLVRIVVKQLATL
jgi:LPS-assembly lipoprotein